LRFSPLELEGAYVVDLEPIQDERGMFARAFCAREFEEHGLEPAVAHWVEGALASLLTLGAIAWAVGIYQILDLSIYTEQFAAAMLAVALALAYVHLPARRGTGRHHVPWYDWIAVIASLGAAGYLGVGSVWALGLSSSAALIMAAVSLAAWRRLGSGFAQHG